MDFDFDAILAEILNVEVGTGAADSGATLPVVGMKCWKHWLRLPWIRAHEAEIKYDRCNKLFFSVVARLFPQRFVFLFR